MQLKISPTREVVIALGILALEAFFIAPIDETFTHLLATVGFAIALFYLFQFITKKPKNLDNTLTTSLIIFLLVHHLPAPPDIYFTLAITLSAMISKFFLNWRGMPIFNPAVFGILSIFILSKIFLPITPFISWWGAAYSVNAYIGETTLVLPFALIIVALWALFGAKRWRKFPIILSFLIAHALLFFTFNQNLETLKFIFTDATIYFLATIMLIEPKTSPIIKTQQIIFGIIAALSYNLLNYLQIPLAEVFGIAVANLYFFSQKFLMLNRNAQKSETNT